MKIQSVFPKWIVCPDDSVNEVILILCMWFKILDSGLSAVVSRSNPTNCYCVLCVWVPRSFCLSLLLILFSGTQCTASSGSVFVEGVLPGCQYECRITMYLESLEKESVSFLSRLFVHFENICVNVCGMKGGVRHAWMCTWCQSVWTELVCVHSACNSSPATSTLCLDNVKSTVNVLCSSGHQICVLAPLVILVMSQLILVPHGLSVLLSHLQSHFTWIITTFYLYYASSTQFCANNSEWQFRILWFVACQRL